MEITINTEDLMGDEESMRDEIIGIVSGGLRKSANIEIRGAIDRLITKELEKQIELQVKAQIKVIVKKELDHKFTPVDDYGNEKEETSIRKRLKEHFRAQAIFKKGRYDSGENVFSEVVIDAYKKELSNFKNDFNKTIDGEFLKECHNYAVVKIQERLKIR